MRTGYRQFCTIARTLDLVGQRWTLLVVRELLLRGPLTATEIARGLPGVPMNQLAERLALLEARGLVTVPSGDERVPPARVYQLTEAGHDLGGVLDALARFGLERLGGKPEPDELVLPHVLMRQLELRYDAAAAGRERFAGRFELVLEDPDALWSVEAGSAASDHWALIATPEEIRIRPGACLDPDATLRMSVDACTRLVAADQDPQAEVEVLGDRDLAEGLLGLLGTDVRTGTVVAA